MAKINGGVAFVNTLQQLGVKHLFSLAGGHITPIHMACKDADFSIIDTRHEQAAGFMAEAWGRVTRTPGVVLVTAGPGFTNVLSAVANATMANSPMVIVSGRVGLKMAERLDLQEVEQFRVIEPLTKWSAVITDVKRIPEFLSRAFAIAISGRPGPVYLEIPVDVLSDEFDEPDPPFVPFPIPKPFGADDDAVAEAVEMLKNAERPVLIAGSGAHYDHAENALVEFAEATGIPIYTVSMGKGVMSEKHPLCFGPAIVTRPGSAFTTLPTADVVVLLGARISLFFAHGQVFSKNTKFIQIDVAEYEPSRNRHIHLPILAGPKAFLAKSAEKWKADVGEAKFGSWVEQLQASHDSSMQMYEPQFIADQKPILPLRLAAEINKFMGDDGIVIADGGDNSIWTGMARDNFLPGHYLDSGLFGCLGVGIPYGNAAKLAHPDKKVLVSIGDGSVGFNFMEFHTALRHQIPLVVVVANDCSWGMIRHSQQLRYNNTWHCTDLGEVRYDEMVKILGGHTETVTEPDEIAPALKRAFDSGKTACINILVDPTVISPGSVALAEVSKGGGY
jgi:thiamine pyrophosphate-dependent acetolactate synthase large subunit-like protein